MDRAPFFLPSNIIRIKNRCVDRALFFLPSFKQSSYQKPLYGQSVLPSFLPSKRIRINAFQNFAIDLKKFNCRSSLRFPRHTTEPLIASLLLRYIAPSVPSPRSSHDGVAHCSLLRFSCVANGVCLWRRRSVRFAHRTTASLIASLLLRRERRVPVAPSIPSLRLSHDGVAHCFASLASHGGVAYCFASLKCLCHRLSLRSARHMATSLIASLLSRCKRHVPLAPSVLSLRSSLTASFIVPLLSRCERRVPMAPSVPSLRSSDDGAAHCFASLALHSAVGPFASLVT